MLIVISVMSKIVLEKRHINMIQKNLHDKFKNIRISQYKYDDRKYYETDFDLLDVDIAFIMFMILSIH